MSRFAVVIGAASLLMFGAHAVNVKADVEYANARGHHDQRFRIECRAACTTRRRAR